MPSPQIIRPPLTEDKRKELEGYLADHYDRAVAARDEQLKDKFPRWQQIYDGVPFEKTRNVPWYKSSNFVVKLVRMFADTFEARTLNILFATRPLYVLEGFPREIREAVEEYFNLKALRVWRHYPLVKQMIHNGPKNGTAVVKTPYVERSVWAVDSQEPDEARRDKETVIYSGPFSRVIPFDDFNCYPITANSLDDVVIKFHTQRYVEEQVMRKVLAPEGGQPVWKVDPDEVKRALQQPGDIKRMETEEEAGLNDYTRRELKGVECYLEYPVTNDPDRYYPIVAIYSPVLRRLLDVYFDPYPAGCQIFSMYRPFPKEDLIFGESICEILDQTQEEASAIHNARRNNSDLANSVMFKVRSGSGIPNASTNWYPGKVWTLENMEDFEIVNNVGRNYGDMINEEQFTIQFAQQLVHISEVMTGAATGTSDRKGEYNTQGTLGVLAESNQPQDTNIRDVRLALSEVAKTSWILQRTFGSNDPALDEMDPKTAALVRQAFSMSNQQRMALSHFDVQASDAGANKETKRAALMAMASTLGQYGSTFLQLVQQRMTTPALAPAVDMVAKMWKGLATELLRAFDEGELEDLVPDVEQAMAAGAASGPPGGGPGGPGGVPGGPGPAGAGGGAPGGGGMGPGGAGGGPGLSSLAELRALTSAPGSPAGGAGR